MHRLTLSLALGIALFAPVGLGSRASAQTSHQVDLSGEILSADDISIEATKLDSTLTRGPWDFALGLGANHYGLDYVNSLFASATYLESSTVLADIAVTRRWGRHWQASVNARAYDGFADYRSLWLSEYYRENWAAFPSYQPPQPSGQAAGLTSTWHYMPGAGLVELGVDFGRDQVAPAWSFDPFIGEPVSSREKLNTQAGQLRIEQALNGWLKTEVAVARQSTSERDERWSIRHAWAASAGPVAARLSGGYTREEPSFESRYGGLALEWNFLPAWTLTTRYRLYHDTGEIAQSSFTAAAPALDTRETYVGLLWERQALALSFGVGFLKSDYAPLTTDNSFFGELYRDRDWTNVRAAASFRF